MLIDTSGWLCLYHKDEPQHLEAIELYQNTRVRLTTNYILAEFVPLAHTRGFPRIQTIKFTEQILDSAEIEIIWIDEIIHRQAVALLKEPTKIIRCAMRSVSS